jgi:citrate synthase
MPQQTRYLTAQQAADALGVTRETLYAYTSRGQVRSEAVAGKTRERRYLHEDVERLRERKQARRDPAAAAARGLHWGSPVLDSSLTLIHDDNLYYRGQDAVTLAATASLEQAAELLWAAEGDVLWEQPCVVPAPKLVRLRTCVPDAVPLFQAALALAGTVDPAAYDLRPAAVRKAGARILRLFTAILVGRASQGLVHRALCAAWAPRQQPAREAIRAALVLCADHELNVSSFTARCAASAAASPYDAVSAALATLKGHRHGAATERVAALFTEAATPRRARAVVADRLRRGESVAGFGHPLYRRGDPRAAMLLRLADQSGNLKEWRLARAVSDAGAELLEERPNLDFGLVALARAYGLPHGAPLILFALGRTVGWIAHAIEQYAGGELIRPRARYVGVGP